MSQQHADPVPRPRIVVGVDGSEHSKLALRWAARLAEAEGASIEAVAAWEFPATFGWAAVAVTYSPRDDVRRCVDDAIAEVFGNDPPDGLVVRVIEGGAARALIAAARDAHMLVVGSRGHGGFVGLLLGSVSNHVAEHATCPVLVVHGPAPAQRASLPDDRVGDDRVGDDRVGDDRVGDDRVGDDRVGAAGTGRP